MHDERALGAFPLILRQPVRQLGIVLEESDPAAIGGTLMVDEPRHCNRLPGSRRLRYRVIG